MTSYVYWLLRLVQEDKVSSKESYKAVCEKHARFVSSQGISTPESQQFAEQNYTSWAGQETDIVSNDHIF